MRTWSYYQGEYTKQSDLSSFDSYSAVPLSTLLSAIPIQNFQRSLKARKTEVYVSSGLTRSLTPFGNRIFKNNTLSLKSVLKKTMVKITTYHKRFARCRAEASSLVFPRVQNKNSIYSKSLRIDWSEAKILYFIKSTRSLKRDRIYKFKILYLEFKYYILHNAGYSTFDETSSSCTRWKAAVDRLVPVISLSFLRFYRLKKEDLTHATQPAVLFNRTLLIFTVPQWPHVFWFNDHTQKKSQNNQKNIRQTSLEFTSLPRQKLKFHVWWSCFPYRRRNSGIVWTADGCSITTTTEGLSPEQCKHRLPRDVTSLSSFERSWV